ncbi:hypothetical protein BGW42_005898 [Actinomortierella wolfii]|nr:hypothetical protein BGW42_005898 [Actinomortierella wolfii]
MSIIALSSVSGGSLMAGAPNETDVHASTVSTARKQLSFIKQVNSANKGALRWAVPEALNQNSSIPPSGVYASHKVVGH